MRCVVFVPTAPRWRANYLRLAAHLDAYLTLARTILRIERRPLSARSILTEAYRSGLVPSSLHGRAQHKTLQARLSEDIVKGRDRSAFFRSAPGRFFLREFLSDRTIPDSFRRPFPARRRFRELLRGPVLAIDANALRDIDREGFVVSRDVVLGLFRENRVRYVDPRDLQSENVLIRSFVCVCRNQEILTYRVGRYRDDRDDFMARRSIGFSTLVSQDEHTMFNIHDFGVVECGVRVTKVDLDFPSMLGSSSGDEPLAYLSHFIWVPRSSGTNDLLAVITFTCPEWFEPTKRRLALNDLRWLDLTRFNNLDDFDPWSRRVLEATNQSETIIESALGS